ncbi:hypothetical protein [Paraburkholderia pallida]|uniref:Uncharacterized protein n=1 Tax=Paraburkholderia pallida TaxID=2547399 RepID=A0A4P7CYP5_9BURK|nr:hypothetical protein [Paraburkholderia pallida]QBQ99956.1 hypothetical protein E1956_22830 [Paraburkholderia pallida]
MAVEIPKFTRIEGRLNKITLSGTTKVYWQSFIYPATYQFKIGQRDLVFSTGTSDRDSAPFLAEGDQVAVAVLDGASDNNDPRMVYGLYSLEDECGYVAHYRWMNVKSKNAATRIAPNSEFKYIGAVSALLGVSFAIDYALARPLLWPEAAWPIASVAAVWLLCTTLLLIKRWRWKVFHRPTRRQRIVEEIYRCLDLGSPHCPDKKVQSV